MLTRNHLAFSSAVAATIGGGVIIGRATKSTDAPAQPAAIGSGSAAVPSPSDDYDAAGPSRQPGDTFAATTKHLAALSKPTTRQFDLLSEIVDPGRPMATSASLSWPNVHDCTWIVAPQALAYFPDNQLAVMLAGGKATATAKGTNKGARPARFAAVVTCETADADTKYVPRDFAASWPPLVPDPSEIPPPVTEATPSASGIPDLSGTAPGLAPTTPPIPVTATPAHKKGPHTP